ncbi:relaxase [Chryseobacterium shandongense]|uniref:Relaxase n=1 Tax=Chryseobacterium shandongense TaxID=1493872 RepID=A0AAD1DKD5_9FLAO|nr:conjugal transfer protein MobB [Chryseobacterium shandongense]AZA85461.1 relaxase [Chryseobacterium shandongense]AZA97568.1 relaxase [Chryseobacterium shandongense]
MIAKLGRSSNLYGALAYNNTKVEKEKAKILFTNKIIETSSGKYSVSQLAQSFESYLAANRNTEKHTLHISLNPDPKDNVSDESFMMLAQDYMQEMGYGEQPFVVFKHMDIDRSHIHIVSVCVDEDGKKISDRFERRRSMEVCRALEKKYGLSSAIEKNHSSNQVVFNPINHQVGNLKNQIASVIRHLPKYYRFRTFGEYNALLSLFNITAEKVEGELGGKMQKGLLYFALNTEGEIVGHPFKASLFGKNLGLVPLESYFEKCKESLKNDESKFTLINFVSTAMKSTTNEKDFKTQLKNNGVNTVVRRNKSGLMYGITFIDHNSKTVWNGSSLGKMFSSNFFNEKWNNTMENVDVNARASDSQKKEKAVVDIQKVLHLEKPYHLFKFLDADQTNGQNEEGLFSAIAGLFSFTSGEDYQEQEFANQMKKRRKRKR